MSERIVIRYDDPGLGPDGSSRDEVVEILERMLPYMLDNVVVMVNHREEDDPNRIEDDADHNMMIGGDTAD